MNDGDRWSRPTSVGHFHWASGRCPVSPGNSSHSKLHWTIESYTLQCHTHKHLNIDRNTTLSGWHYLHSVRDRRHCFQCCPGLDTIWYLFVRFWFHSSTLPTLKSEQRLELWNETNALHLLFETEKAARKQEINKNCFSIYLTLVMYFVWGSQCTDVCYWIPSVFIGHNRAEMYRSRWWDFVILK